MLSLDEIRRYGRQLVLPEIGLAGQQRIKAAAALVVGAGGLGCPAATYLVGAGIGRLGIVDADSVDVSNQHRQFLHCVEGQRKTESAIAFLRSLNPHVELRAYDTLLDANNALDICRGYDVLLDCTDTPAARYLISDTAVLLGTPVVSGAALKADGQLVVYNYAGGPCYRCIFPVPPPASSCSDHGILGPVVGTIGVLQALETIKLLIGRLEKEPTMLLFHAFTSPQFRSVRLRNKKPECRACGTQSSLTIESLTKEDASCTASFPSVSNIHAEAYARLTKKHILLDVRDATQFGICAMPNARNMPWESFETSWTALPHDQPIYVVCRNGNDSRLAVAFLCDRGIAAINIMNGLAGWREVDPQFPCY